MMPAEAAGALERPAPHGTAKEGEAAMALTTGSAGGSRPAPRWLGPIFLLLGLGLMAGAGIAVWLELSFRARAVETDGRIVEMIRETTRGSGGGSSTNWTPVFAYRLPDGREVRVTASFSSSPPCCKVGDAVRVRYDPADPMSGRMTGFLSSWLLPTILGGMGSVFTLLGLVLPRMLRRRTALDAGAGAFGGAPPPPGLANVEAPLVGLRRAGEAYILQARWTDPRSGAQRLFESPPIPFDPVPQMRHMDRVRVAFDPSLPDGPSWMDLSFLRDPRRGEDATLMAGPPRRG